MYIYLIIIFNLYLLIKKNKFINFINKKYNNNNYLFYIGRLMSLYFFNIFLININLNIYQSNI